MTAPINNLLRRLRALVRREESEAQLNDELEFHLAMEADSLRQRGIRPDAAAGEARRRFGGVDRYTEECRDERGGRFLEALAQDARYAARVVRRAPSFTAIVVLTLGFAIGANTAIFTVVNAALLRPLPFDRGHELVSIFSQNPEGEPRFSVSHADLLEWQRDTRSFQGIAAVVGSTLILTGDQEPERLVALAVTPNYFDVLGMRPALGRSFDAAGIDRHGASSPSIILGDGFWRRRFGADSGIIGRTLTVSGRPRTVIGVLPPTFDVRGRLIDAVTVLDPSAIPGVENHGQHMLSAIGRLKPGVTVEQAHQDLRAVAARQAETYADIKGWTTNVFSTEKELVRDLRNPLLILLAAAAFVLVIGCINVANLLLARGAARGREISLRQALGASRSRLVSLLLVESGVLALLGGGLGVLLAVAGTRAILRIVPVGFIPRQGEVRLDAAVLGFAAGLSLLTALIVGLWPALRAVNPRPAAMLRDGGRGTASGTPASRMRRTLVIAEVSLALVLLVCSGLVLQSMRYILRTDPGFSVDGVATMRLSLSAATYPESTQVQFYREFIRRLEGRGGIVSAAAANTPPISGGGIVTPIRLIGEPPPASAIQTPLTGVTPGYFRTMGMRLLRGRDVSWTDAQPTIVASEAAAKRLWPGADPLGKRVAFGRRDTLGLEVVGLVGDTRARGLTTETPAMLYISHSGVASVARTMSLVVRGTGDPASLAPTTRSVLRELDPTLPVYNVQLVRDVLNESIAQPRLNTTLLTIFAAMALLLAAIGIYGVVSYSVAQRSQELGVRMALGATQSDVFRLVLREGATLAGAGVVLGLIGAVMATRVIQAWLFGIGRRDPATMAAMSVALVIVALVACLVPARRATRVDPVRAIRGE
jgi:putative ABC transport system permease protein